MKKLTHCHKIQGNGLEKNERNDVILLSDTICRAACYSAIN